MTYVLRLVHIGGNPVATGRKGLTERAVKDALSIGPDQMVGEYLKTADIEAHGGRGDATFTADPAKAMQFESFGEALDYWRQQSKTRPLRPDGKPNRPLTAFNISIEQHLKT